MGSCLLRRWLGDRRGVEAPLLLRLRRPLDDLDLELNEEFDLDPSRLRDLDLRLLLLVLLRRRRYLDDREEYDDMLAPSLPLLGCLMKP